MAEGSSSDDDSTSEGTTQDVNYQNGKQSSLEGRYDAAIKHLLKATETDPKNAEENTIRKLFGISIDKNSVHGSDSIENAKKEIGFFFSESELITNH